MTRQEIDRLKRGDTVVLHTPFPPNKTAHPMPQWSIGTKFTVSGRITGETKDYSTPDVSLVEGKMIFFDECHGYWTNGELEEFFCLDNPLQDTYIKL